MNLSLILLNTSCEIYSIPRESKYTVIFISVSNEIQCVPLRCLSSRFMTYNTSSILGKLSFEKAPLNQDS